MKGTPDRKRLYFVAKTQQGDLNEINYFPCGTTEKNVGLGSPLADNMQIGRAYV